MLSSKKFIKISKKVSSLFERINKNNFSVYKNVQTIEELFQDLKTQKEFIEAETDYTKTLNKLSLAIYKSMMTEYNKSVKSYSFADYHKLLIDQILYKWDYFLEDNIENGHFLLIRDSGPFKFKLKIKALDLGNRNLLVKKINDYLVKMFKSA